MKFLVVALGVLVAISSIVYVYHVEVAGVLWRYTKQERIVYALDPSAERAFVIGKHFFNLGEGSEYNLEKAEYYLREALRQDPNYSGPLYHLGRIDFLHSRFLSAIDKFNRQLDIHEASGDEFVQPTYYMRGLTYGYMGNFSEAEEDFRYIIEKSKEEGEVPKWAYYVDLGWVYFSQGKFVELGVVSWEAYTHYPNNPWVLSNLGLALMNQGYDREAEAVFELALYEAQRLTEAHWIDSYPGNDPRLASQGLREMREAILSNLKRAVDKQTQGERNSVL